MERSTSIFAVVVRLDPQERVQRIAEHIVDVPVPQIVEVSVEVGTEEVV